MSITKDTIKETLRNIMKEESEYQTFFKKALEKAGKDIPSMSDEEKKEFFNKIDAAWDGKGEKNEELVGNQKKLDVDGDGEIEADDLAALRAGEKANESHDCGCGCGGVTEGGCGGSVVEGVSPKDMESIKGAVQSASSFMNIGSELKKLGMKYIFATSPMPIYVVQDKGGNRVGIVNKKYATKPDFVHGDTAVGVMESLTEGRAFINAAKKAKAEGKTEFEFNGKTYPVTIKESVNEAASFKITNTISKKEWAKTHKDYKSVIDGVPYVMKLTDKGTALVPVKIVESVNEAQKINPTSMKFLKGMKKIKVNGLGGYMPGVDYVYVDGDKYYFVDSEGDHMELKNTNTIKQLHKLHGKSLGESVNEDTKKRFDVDFYKVLGDRQTSQEEIIRGDKFSDVISQATKVAKSKGMNYVEFYYKDAFIGSIDKKSNYTFKKGRNSEKSPLSVNEGKKRFNTNYGVGKSKYVVNYHDGVKKHKDGSDFFDVQIFKNQNDLEAFKKALLQKGFVAESVVNEDRNMNVKVKQLLDKGLSDLSKGKPNHQFAVMHILKSALTDANFHSEAKKVESIFSRAKYEGDPRGEKDVIGIYEEMGENVASICKWDGKDIVDAIGFYVSMTIGRPVGEKIEKLVESVNETIYLLKNK